MIQYNKYCIYAIVWKYTGEVVYVGSCRRLMKRITNHKHESKLEKNRKIYKHINFFGWDKFYFKVLAENIVIPPKNKNMLRTIEDLYRKSYNPRLNSYKCIKSLNIADTP